jgi:hypothetical protein
MSLSQPGTTVAFEDTGKREEFERRARECTKALHGLMTEAKREGYAIEVYSSLGMSGEPQSRVAVLAR